MHVIDQVLDLIESTSEMKRSNLRQIYLSQFGPSIIPFCIARFSRTSRAPIRSDLLRFLIRYAKTSDEVCDFGIRALNDRSKVVRESACALLAYSGKRRALEPLRDLSLKSKQGKDDPALRAIDAIEHSDHNRFYPRYDRWIVSQDNPDYPRREDVDFYFARAAPELMPRLREIFGNPYAKFQAG